MNGELRDYFRRLDRLLACPRPLRRKLTAQVLRAKEDYLREYPEAGPAEVIQYLGQPEEVARTLLDSLDPAELERSRRRDRRLRWSLVAVLAAALVIVGAWGIHLWGTPKNVEITETLIIYTDSSEGIS